MERDGRRRAACHWATSVVAQTTAEVALYILNHKRDFIIEMERRYSIAIAVRHATCRAAEVMNEGRLSY